MSVIAVPAYNPSASSTPATTAAPSTAAAQSKAVGSTPRGSGIDELALPQKYLRRAIDPEEMEYIEVGIYLYNLKNEGAAMIRHTE